MVNHSHCLGIFKNMMLTRPPLADTTDIIPADEDVDVADVAASSLPDHELQPEGLPGDVGDVGAADAPVHAAVAPVDPPWDTLYPKQNAYRNAIVRYALPRLLPLLRDPAHRLTSNRQLVENALDLCERAGDRFWGTYLVYSRRRSAIDAILSHYFDILQDFVAGRRPVVL